MRLFYFIYAMKKCVAYEISTYFFYAEKGGFS